MAIWEAVKASASAEGEDAVAVRTWWDMSSQSGDLMPQAGGRGDGAH